jgi:deoxycytidylate deaminase
MEAVKKIEVEVLAEPKGRNAKEKVDKTLTEEIIIAICAPIGSLKEKVLDALKRRLEEYGYDHQVIKLSSLISEHYNVTQVDISGHTSSFSQLQYKIDGGNALRNKHSNSILAEFAIGQIYFDRIAEFSSAGKLVIENIKTRRKCYIIDSIKNTAELQLLRAVYREIIYFVSIYSPLNERIDNLLSKDLSRKEINKLIETDEFENNQFGQKVRDVFTEADFFIRASSFSLKDIDLKIERYSHLIFNSKIITPFVNEIAMYQAKSAAGNSACLSRQVGAAITDKTGDVISTGWNDVPKFGGNLYREDSLNDRRCKNIGHCSNDSTKDSLTKNIVDNIINDELLKTKLFDGKEINPLSNEFLHLTNIVRKSTKVKDLIEFSRSVHAEMHAIIVGSQLAGTKMVDGKLFCTTYPCHNCARHIIVAGIKEIYYIEPYVKSLCILLHEDAITENEEEDNKVRILVYDGVAPRRFLEFFTMSDNRKSKSGTQNNYDLKTIFPKTRLTLQAIPTLEAQAIHSLRESGVI